MTDQDILDIGGLVHSRWIDAMDTLKRVGDERPDGSDDWAEFHATRLEMAQAGWDHWSELKRRFMEENRGVYDRLLRNVGI